MFLCDFCANYEVNIYKVNISKMNSYFMNAAQKFIVSSNGINQASVNDVPILRFKRHKVMEQTKQNMQDDIIQR